jgi:hypothetical protein
VIAICLWLCQSADGVNGAARCSSPTPPTRRSRRVEAPDLMLMSCSPRLSPVSDPDQRHARSAAPRHYAPGISADRPACTSQAEHPAQQRRMSRKPSCANLRTQVTATSPQLSPRASGRYERLRSRAANSVARVEGNSLASSLPICRLPAHARPPLGRSLQALVVKAFNDVLRDMARAG